MEIDEPNPSAPKDMSASTRPEAEGKGLSDAEGRGRDIMLHFDHHEENRIEHVAQMQAFKNREFSKLEKFYIDVANVYDTQLKREHKIEEKETSDDDEDVKSPEDDEHFVDRMDRYLRFARTQVENIKQTVSLTLNKDHLLLRPAAPTIHTPSQPQPPPSSSPAAEGPSGDPQAPQDGTTPAVGVPVVDTLRTRLHTLALAKRQMLKHSAQNLKAHANRLKASVERGRKFARKLYDLSKFWSLRLANANGDPHGYQLWVPYAFNREALNCAITLNNTDIPESKEKEVVILQGLPDPTQTTKKGKSAPKSDKSSWSRKSAEEKLTEAQRINLNQSLQALLMNQASRLEGSGVFCTTSPDRIEIHQPAQASFVMEWIHGPKHNFTISTIPSCLSAALNLMALRHMTDIRSIPPRTSGPSPPRNSKTSTQATQSAPKVMLWHLIEIVSHWVTCQAIRKILAQIMEDQIDIYFESTSLSVHRTSFLVHSSPLRIDAKSSTRVASSPFVGLGQGMPPSASETPQSKGKDKPRALRLDVSGSRVHLIGLAGVISNAHTSKTTSNLMTNGFSSPSLKTSTAVPSAAASGSQIFSTRGHTVECESLDRLEVLLRTCLTV
ncbi:hypothetical protein AAMO2058_000625200 [Amorphochlora amoebiformis]